MKVLAIGITAVATKYTDFITATTVSNKSFTNAIVMDFDIESLNREYVTTNAE